MAVSYQTWEWSNIEESETSGPSQRIPMNGRAITLVANQPYDMFVGTVGNQTSIPPATRATQFIVLEDMGVTPTNGSSLQVVVNTTSYFEDPDGAVSQGFRDNHGLCNIFHRKEFLEVVTMGVEL